MERFAWVVWIGGGVLGYVAGEMFFADPAIGRWVEGAPALAYVVSAVLGLAIAARRRPAQSLPYSLSRR